MKRTQRRAFCLGLAGPTVALAAACLVLGGAGTTVQAAEPGWMVDAAGLIGFPLSPGDFRDDWSTAWGITGSVRRRVSPRLAVGLAGEYLQFGLADVDAPANADVTGGARRFGRGIVPAWLLLWESTGRSATTLDLRVGLGYAHESLEPVSGLDPPRPGAKRDGVAWTAGFEVAFALVSTTRLEAGLRADGAWMSDVSPAWITLQFGLQTPLGSEPPR